MLKEQIDADMKAALREKDADRLATLRLLKAAIVNREKEAAGRELDDAAVLDLIQKEIKQARESLEMYRKSPAHQKQAEQMEARIATLSAYLPKQMNEDEIREFVKAYLERVKPQSKGEFMKGLMAEIQGRADKREVSRIAAEVWG
ncbi:MAG: GatB/YqeY domain-containing protein [Clostridia bacterium]|nr:GatB/YqeY domain-containing protein [Clostridia bacterium]